MAGDLNTNYWYVNYQVSVDVFEHNIMQHFLQINQLEFKILDLNDFQKVYNAIYFFGSEDEENSSNHIPLLSYQNFLFKRGYNGKTAPLSSVRNINATDKQDRTQHSVKNLEKFMQTLFGVPIFFPTSFLQVGSTTNLSENHRPILDSTKLKVELLESCSQNRVENFTAIIEGNKNFEYISNAIDILYNAFRVDNATIPKFILLVSLLEFLFNRGKDQIRQIISRHGAILISNNKDEFLINFKKIQKIYDLRCAIVHGSHTEISLENVIDVLCICQEILFKIVEKPLKKEELFEYCNLRGF